MSEKLNELHPAFRYELVDWSETTGYEGSTAVRIVGDPYRSHSPVFASVERAEAFIKTDSERYVVRDGTVYTAIEFDTASDLKCNDLVVRRSPGNKRLLYVVHEAEESEDCYYRIRGWRSYWWGLGKYTTVRVHSLRLKRYVELAHSDTYRKEFADG